MVFQTKIRVTSLKNERKFNICLNSLKEYRLYFDELLQKRKVALSLLPPRQQALLQEYEHGLVWLVDCVEKNQRFFDTVADSIALSVVHDELPDPSEEPLSMIIEENENIHNLLRHITREWSDCGAHERKLCFDPIIEAITSRFPGQDLSPNTIKILVPGAGLGRLPLELAEKGFNVVYNESDEKKIILGGFFISNTTEKNTQEIHPWLLPLQNQPSLEAQVEGVKIPDIDHIKLESIQLSLEYGDFLQIFQKEDMEGSYDCVATCFFIDRVDSILDVVERIYLLLKPGGVWVNLGPLLYPTATSRYSMIQLPYTALKEVIENLGFHMEEEKLDLETPYLYHKSYMSTHWNKSVFMVCKKPDE